MRTATALLFALVLMAGCAADEPASGGDGDPDETVASDDGANEATDDEGSQDDEAGTPADGGAVTIVGFSFDPDTITVEVGDTVVWTNEDSARHNVTADDDSFVSDNLAEGETFRHTFEEAGTFDYVCTLHSGMTASVEVG
jgi:plastocyanin